MGHLHLVTSCLAPTSQLSCQTQINRHTIVFGVGVGLRAYDVRRRLDLHVTYIQRYSVSGFGVNLPVKGGRLHVIKYPTSIFLALNFTPPFKKLQTSEF